MRDHGDNAGEGIANDGTEVATTAAVSVLEWVPWADALGDASLGVRSLEHTMEALDVYCDDKSFVIDKNDPTNILGRLDWSWGSTLSATCRGCGHGRCKIMLTVRQGVCLHGWAQADLIKWLAAGRSQKSQ